MSIGPFETEQDFVSQFTGGFVNASESVACFAVIDKRKPPSLADLEGELPGMVSYMSTTAVPAEVGYSITLPPYQRITLSRILEGTWDF
ncbi:uncharacterized protein N7482_003401 [Penicillium canariense]|uniref:Uncharacterized protein n=1 Tax=Penicillium canariense TaxID=189055 RepID=A0A9W9IAB0_9EURO|nr:uncharacterized protein N7482_003401 [Penicillium canariense]KAJ5167807.1 hypothetical protein N7482_003401 [Penicillium canariense]